MRERGARKERGKEGDREGWVRKRDKKKGGRERERKREREILQKRK